MSKAASSSIVGSKLSSRATRDASSAVRTAGGQDLESRTEGQDARRSGRVFSRPMRSITFWRRPVAARLASAKGRRGERRRTELDAE